MELEEIRAAHELKPSLWVEGMVNESGFPIEFKNHRFLIDIYNDLSPLQVILKPPQIGATVMNVLKALYVASHYNKQIIYTLPTATDMYEMVGSGFNRIIAQNPDLRELVAEGDTMEHKAVGNGLIRFRGTFSAKQAMMVPSDLNIHDEVDASDAAIITQYETRLQAKADGMRWYFSHPSLAGYGVDTYWNQSDKKEWFITCHECGYEQVLEWPDNISKERAEYICRDCKGALSSTDRASGEWRATDNGAFSGYHISQLMCPWITAEKIIEASEDPNKTEQYFYNYVLGLPYAASDDLISAQQVLENVSEDFNPQKDRVIIGVDTGLPIYYTLMNKEGVFNFGRCEAPSASYDPYKHLEGFLLRWPKSILVSDQGGDLIGIRQLQAKYPGRVYLCFYRKDRKTREMIQWGEKEELGKVTVDRNRMIQMMVEQLREGNRIKLNGTREEWKPFADHFANIYRTKEEGPFGVEYQWERKGPDHWVHSLLYALVGWDRFAGMPETIGDLKWIGNIEEAANLEEMTFDDLRRMVRHNKQHDYR